MLLWWLGSALADPAEVVRLQILERGSGIPIPSATVTDSDGTVRTADPDGWVIVEVGTLITIGSEDHRPVTVILSSASEPIRLDRYDWSEEVIVYGLEETDGIDREVLGIEELRRVPGSFGDPVRALQALPSVARPRSVEGGLVVRGAEAMNTGAYIDGIQVPFLFHFLAGKSVISPSLIGRIEFYPGALPARFGDVAQAVVNAETEGRVHRKGAIHGDVHIDPLELGGATQIALGDRAHLRLGGRISWLSSIVRAGQLARDSVLGISEPTYRPEGIRFPYSDHYARLQYTIAPDHRVYATLFGAHDGLSLIPDRGDVDDDGVVDPPVEVPEGKVDFDHLLTNQFDRLVVGLEGQAGAFGHDTHVALGRDRQRNLVPGLGVFADTPQDLDTSTRTAWIAHHHRVTLSRGLTWVGGVDLRSRATTLVPLGVGPSGDDEGDPVVAPQHWVGPYGGIEATVGPLWIAPGIRGAFHRLDGDGYSALEPRGSARLRLSDRVSVHGYLGRLTQAPIADRYALDDGSPALLTRVIQASGGIEVLLGASWVVSADGYRSTFADLVVSEDLPILVPEDHEFDRGLSFAPAFTATTGSAVGGELMIRRLPADGWSGWLAITAGRSRRLVGGVQIPGDYDVPLDTTLVLARDLPKDWGISGRIRLGAGQSYTPAHGTYLAAADLYVRTLGEPNSARNPTFFQVDLRVDKTWTARRSRWTLYLDLFNATNHPNPLIADYNWDVSERETKAYIPILPVLGAEVSF